MQLGAMREGKALSLALLTLKHLGLPLLALLQLLLLTKRNAPAPAETWGDDVAKVFASAFDARQVRRLQNIFKALLKR